MTEFNSVIYSTDATSIYVVPLLPGIPPNLSQGVQLSASNWLGANPTRPPSLRGLSNGDFIAIWYGDSQAGYSRFSSNADGSFTETIMGEWLAGWSLQGASDLNQDGLDDLLLIHKTQQGFGNYEYKVALGQSDGSFDFSAAPIS
ncbi:MAG: hypothetical protein LDL41_23145, partial [Coleofasciculus sp. S288]|nr:hypothetical protein [Coleofasciculus sp. S288]